MRRHLLGIIGLVALVAFVALLFSAGAEDSNTKFAAAICMRTGVVFLAIWLAMPQLESISKKLPRWAWICVALGIVVLVARPSMFPVALALFGLVAIVQFFAWLFKPLPSQQQRKKPRQD